MCVKAELKREYYDLTNTIFTFVQKDFEGIVPAGKVDEEIYWKTKSFREELDRYLNRGQEQEAEALAEKYLRFACSYYRQGMPWEAKRTDRRSCRNTILNSLQLLANLTVFLAAVGEREGEEDIVKFTEQVQQRLQLEPSHISKVQSVHSGSRVSAISKG